MWLLRRSCESTQTISLRPSLLSLNTRFLSLEIKNSTQTRVSLTILSTPHQINQNWINQATWRKDASRNLWKNSTRSSLKWVTTSYRQFNVQITTCPLLCTLHKKRRCNTNNHNRAKWEWLSSKTWILWPLHRVVTWSLSNSKSSNKPSHLPSSTRSRTTDRACSSHPRAFCGPWTPSSAPVFSACRLLFTETTRM